MKCLVTIFVLSPTFALTLSLVQNFNHYQRKSEQTISPSTHPMHQQVVLQFYRLTIHLDMG